MDIFRVFRFLIGAIFFLIGFVIIDKNDLLDLVNHIKGRLNND